MYPLAVDKVVARSEPMRIRLLGGFRISVGPQGITGDAWRLRKSASLIKLLALSPGHRLPRERVMELLWPRSSKSAASNNLRQTLHAVRKALGAGGSRYLVSEDGSLLLCPEDELRVDAETFEEAALAARRSHEPAAYRLAIDLYAGELLPEDRFEDWAEDERANLRRTYLELLTELVRLYEERGEYNPAAEALQRVVAEEPTNEGAHADLMRLYAISDRQGDALAQYERLKEILWRQLDAEPAAETRRLREDITAGRFQPDRHAISKLEETSGAGTHNLPVSLTSFVGRERELLEAKRMLAMTRLLTLTGTGGSGKTRLALEVAADLVGAYQDGVWLVDLAPLSEPGLLVQEVAGVLEVQERSGEPLLDTLFDALRSRQMLLVLDNCEHLVDGVARLVEDLLRSCPNLQLLATSREPLGVAGEVNLPVPPLSLPDPGRQMTVEELEGYGSARLFVERALYRPSAFALTPENAGAVAEVCRQLEGIPLAIELAAARVGVLAVEQISERLSDSLGLLTGGGRTLTSRQRTLRGSLDWSFALLDEPERKLFGRLAVFAGGWSLEAAQTVCPEDGIGQDEVLDLLSELVDKSLVMVGATASGATRYRMLEPIRQYAREKLEVGGGADEARGRHAAFFLDVAEVAEPELAGPRSGPWAGRLKEEHDNLRAALSWVLERRETELGQRFGPALWRFWYNRDYLSEGRRWLERILADGDPAPERVRALEGMGWLAQHQGDIEWAKAAYEEMLELALESGDRGNVATALNSLGTLAVSTGDNERAKRYLEENLSVLQQLEEEENAATTIKRYHAYNLLGILALNEDGAPARATELWKESLALARETGDSLRIGVSLCCLGYAAVLQGDNERATTLCEETLAFAREHEDAGEEVVPETLVNLGLAALGQGEYERAISSFDEALGMSQRAGRKASLINALEGMASLAGARGEGPLAARLWGAAEKAREVTGIALPPADRALHEPRLSSARSLLGEKEWEEARAKGRAMSLEEAADYAFWRDQVDPPSTPVPRDPSAGEPAPHLSGREREVVVLVARGLTNRQISVHLGISERTAGNHVGRILGKLRLRSRAQIAAWATEHRLPTSDSE
jgi:predicted ATPase/DNA-binding SARP family transcriptional activator/DNA-binding CsgD family transcriptional regulator